LLDLKLDSLSQLLPAFLVSMGLVVVLLVIPTAIRRLFHAVKSRLAYYPYFHPMRYVLTVGAASAICVLIVIWTVPDENPQIHTSAYSQESCRYLLSATAQTIAALLAISFTVAFVIYQKASASGSPKLTAVFVLRNRTLLSILAIGSVCVFTSLFLLHFVLSTEGTQRQVNTGHSGARAMLVYRWPVFSPAVLGLSGLFLTMFVWFLIRVPTWGFLERISAQHVNLLHTLMRRIGIRKLTRKTARCIFEQLEAVPELADALSRADDLERFADLCATIKNLVTQATKTMTVEAEKNQSLYMIHRRVLESAVWAVTDIVRRSERKCMRERELDRDCFSKWSSRALAALRYSGSESIRFGCKEGLVILTDALSTCYLSPHFLTKTESFKQWADCLLEYLNLVNHRVAELERGHEEPDNQTTQAVAEIALERYRELIHACVDLAQPASLRRCVLGEEGQFHSLEWVCNAWSRQGRVQLDENVTTPKADYAAFAQSRLWDIFIDVGGHIIYSLRRSGAHPKRDDTGDKHGSSILCSYLSILVNEVFSYPGSHDYSDSTFLELALNDSIEGRSFPVWDQETGVHAALPPIVHPRFWALLRICLAATGKWQPARMLRGLALRGRLGDQLKRGLEWAGKPGTEDLLRGLWEGDNPLIKQGKDHFNRLLNELSDKVKEYIKEADRLAREAVIKAPLDGAKVAKFIDDIKKALPKARGNVVPVPVVQRGRTAKSECDKIKRITYAFSIRREFLVSDAVDRHHGHSLVGVDHGVARHFATGELVFLLSQAYERAIQVSHLRDTTLANFRSDCRTIVRSTREAMEGELSAFCSGDLHDAFWRIIMSPDRQSVAGKHSEIVNSAEAMRFFNSLRTAPQDLGRVDAIVFIAPQVGNIQVVKPLEISYDKRQDDEGSEEIEFAAEEEIASELNPEMCWAFRVTDLGPFREETKRS